MLCCASPAAPLNTTNSFQIHFHLIFLSKVLPIIDLFTRFYSLVVRFLLHSKRICVRINLDIFSVIGLTKGVIL